MQRCVIRKGRQITFDDHERSPQQVMVILHLRAAADDFAQSLLKQYNERKGEYERRLSPKQWDWAHFIAHELELAKKQEDDALNAQRIWQLLMTVDLKRPCLRFDFLKVKVIFKRWRDRVLVLDDTNLRHAYILENGKVFPYRPLSDAVKATIIMVNYDPMGCASLNGQKTGVCCFCGRLLETKESVTMGYGPVCADKYELPWGSVKAESLIAESCRRMKELFPSLSS